jgi:exodeoxyribonuclease VII small subunit
MVQPTFEQSLNQLEGIVKRLERGELTLEESFAAYEEGMRMVQQAHGALQALEHRLEQLTDIGTTAPLPHPNP